MTEPYQLTTNQLRVFKSIIGLLLHLSELILPVNIKKMSRGDLEYQILKGKQQLDEIGNTYSKGFLRSLGYTMAVKKYERAISLYVRKCRKCGATRFTQTSEIRYWPEEDLCSICMNKDKNIKLTPVGVVCCS